MGLDKTMEEKIHIDKPCTADWSKMTPSSNGRFCTSCEKIVVDFSKKTLDEIKSTLITYGDKKICGRYHARHTTQKNIWFDTLNNIEFVFSKVKLQRLSVFIITILLFLSSCHRRTMGLYAKFDNKKCKHKRHNKTKIQQDSTSR